MFTVYQESVSSKTSKATASLPHKQLLLHYPQAGASAPPDVCVVGIPQQYEAISDSSVSAKHLPTAQSPLHLPS